MSGLPDSTQFAALSGAIESRSGDRADQAVHLSRRQLREFRGPFQSLDDRVPEGLGARGNLSLLDRRLVGLFCSRACPTSLAAAALEMMPVVGDCSLAVVSGFHSPVERACLSRIMGQRRPAVLCLGRAVETVRMPPALEAEVRTGRLLLLSHLPPSIHRLTAGTAVRRNRLVAALADDILIIHASPGGKTETLCHEAITWGKRIFTLESQHNANIQSLGARVVSVESARPAFLLDH